MLRMVSLVLACGVALAAQPAMAGSKKDAAFGPATFSSRQDNEDGSSSLTFGTKLPTAVETKVGVDLGLGSSLDPRRDPSRLLDGPSDQSSGTGWASMAVPAAPFGFTAAKMDARFDPAQDHGKLGMAVSRPLGESLLITLQNSYALSGVGTPISPSQPGYSVETDHALRFEVLSTHTAFSAGTRTSNIDDRALRTISAEQQILGPLSVSGTLTETTTGDIEKVVKAGFRKTW